MQLKYDPTKYDIPGLWIQLWPCLNVSEAVE